MVDNLLVICAGIAGLAALASSCVGTYFYIRMHWHIRDGGPYHWFVRMHRLSLIYFPDELTDVGLRYRSLALKTYFVTVPAYLVMIAAMIAENSHATNVTSH
jgi:hypothetical protein